MKISIVFVYNSFSDPLFAGNIFLYLKNASYNKKYLFYVITYEQEEFTIPSSEKKTLKRQLEKENIYWIPLKWHSGKFKLLKKLFDFSCGLAVIIYLRFLKKAKAIISLGTVSGSVSYFFSRILFIKCFLYQYEPHSEFLLDFGLIKKNSLSFRILHYMEKISGKNAEVIATGTNHMLKRLESEKSKAKTFVVPSCVDENLFSFNASVGKKIREEFGFSKNDIILVYAGKFGGIYYNEEIPAFVKKLISFDEHWKFLIITREDENNIFKLCIKHGLKETDFKITKARYEEMPGLLSAGDIGLVALPPLPSQKFRSPIKVGEYLCCGLPYIVCKSISEDDEWAIKNNIGIVLNDFSTESLSDKYNDIKSLLTEDKFLLRERCRKAGIVYRGFAGRNETMQKAFAKLFS